MSRVSAGAAAQFAAVGGPGTARNQGVPPVAPRPTASTDGALAAVETRRAKAIALGLFVVLVLVHGRPRGD